MRREARHHLALAAVVDGKHLARAPIAQPDASVVPPRRLGKAQAVKHQACGSLSSLGLVGGDDHAGRGRGALDEAQLEPWLS